MPVSGEKIDIAPVSSINELRTTKSGLHYRTIDLARAVAALGVFTNHQHLFSAMAKHSGLLWIWQLDNFGGMYAVPLFFLISGYCIHLSNIKYLRSALPLPLKDYYKRRFLRIYPAYFLAVIFSLAVLDVRTHRFLYPKINLLTHLLLAHGFSSRRFLGLNMALWTIGVEAALYVVYPVFYYLRFKFSINHALAFVFLISCISTAYFSSKNDLELYQKYFFTNLWLPWCCGAFLADKKVFNQGALKKPVYKAIYAVILLIFLYLQVFNPFRFSIVSYQFRILFWTAPLLYLISKERWFSKQKSVIIRLLTAIGLSSYSLYLLHIPLIALVNICTNVFLPARLHSAGLLTGFLLIPVVAWYSYKYIEKPFLKRVKPYTPVSPLN